MATRLLAPYTSTADSDVMSVSTDTKDAEMVEMMGLCNDLDQETFENDYRAALQAARLNKRV